MKEYVWERQAGFGRPHTKWSPSACAIDHETDQLLPSRKPHPVLGCLCCWEAPGWDEQVQRKCGSAARHGKMCCFIVSPLSSYSGCPWVWWRLAWEGGTHFFPVNPLDFSSSSFNIHSLPCWSFPSPSTALHTPDCNNSRDTIWG